MDLFFVCEAFKSRNIYQLSSCISKSKKKVSYQNNLANCHTRGNITKDDAQSFT